jgi:hypothetical protein
VFIPIAANDSARFGPTDFKYCTEDSRIFSFAEIIVIKIDC